MEHDLRNAYFPTQGMEAADLETVKHLFATGRYDMEKRHSNISSLHPCLMFFDGIALVEPRIYGLYQAYNEVMDELGTSEDRKTKASDGSWARLLDDRYIDIKRLQYGKKK